MHYKRLRNRNYFDAGLQDLPEAVFKRLRIGERLVKEPANFVSNYTCTCKGLGDLLAGCSWVPRGNSILHVHSFTFVLMSSSSTPSTIRQRSSRSRRTAADREQATENYRLRQQVTENVKIWVPSIANNSSILAFETMLSILYQMPFSLLKSAMWLRGYSRLKKIIIAPRSDHQTRKTLKSGCLSLLTIRSFGARDGLGLSVRVWLGFGLGLPVKAIDSLTDTV
eukprot:sb/3469691/